MLRSLMHKLVYPIQVVKGSLLIPIGRTRYGKVIFLDLKRIPHTKIAGLTGMGKSNIMLTILYFLCQQLDEKSVDIEIIDLKGGATYAPWINVPHVKGIHARTEDALTVLERCEEEMWKRLEKVRAARAQFKSPPKFPLLVVLIDEGGELAPADALDEEKTMRTRCMQILSTLVRIGREPGIRIIYATQRPDGNTTLPVTIRGQLDNTICFRVREKGDSNIVLGHEGAEQLMVNPGRSIYQSGVTEVEVQGIYIDEESLYEWLKAWAKFTTRGQSVGVVEGQQTIPSDWR